MRWMRFPGFKGKALTLSYDDGVVQDIRLVEIMKKYGIKGTFNLNSGIPAGGRRIELSEAIRLWRLRHTDIHTQALLR